jgi:hypothetical protein
MTEEQIAYKALENLNQITQIEGFWTDRGENSLDGTLELRVDDETLRFNVEIKNELRTYLLPRIFEYNNANKPFMLVATRLFPKIKEELRQHNVSYLEANGNLYLKTPRKWFWIETNEPLKVKQNVGNRAFTKTGIRVVFEFLRDPGLINQPYRQIAEQTGTSIGNITHILNGLKQEGFLVSVSKTKYHFQRTMELLHQWLAAYEKVLKPSLKIGRFRFLDKNGFAHWKDLPLDVPKTLWGGEPAGELLTGYLKPAELILYTGESRAELMKRYKLIPDEAGDVWMYRKFWQQDIAEQATVPPILVYADLINTNDRRCTETAKKIYDEYIQAELP